MRTTCTTVKARWRTAVTDDRVGQNDFTCFEFETLRRGWGTRRSSKRLCTNWVADTELLKVAGSQWKCFWPATRALLPDILLIIQPGCHLLCYEWRINLAGVEWLRLQPSWTAVGTFLENQGTCTVCMDCQSTFPFWTRDGDRLLEVLPSSPQK